jgi:hypothetical protein
MFLSDAEVSDLTGATQPAAQERIHVMRDHDPNHPYVRKLAWKALHMGANDQHNRPASAGPG